MHETSERMRSSTPTVIRGADVVDVRTGGVEAADIRVEGPLIAEVSSRGIRPTAPA